MQAFVHGFRRGNAKKISIVRRKFIEFSALEKYIEVGKAVLFLIYLIDCYFGAVVVALIILYQYQAFYKFKYRERPRYKILIFICSN